MIIKRNIILNINNQNWKIFIIKNPKFLKLLIINIIEFQLKKRMILINQMNKNNKNFMTPII